MLIVNKEKVTLGHFPDQTLLLKNINKNGNEIEWKFESNEELVALIFIVQHLKDQGVQNINLVMKYIPNARQDRVKSSEDVFTLKYFANIINELGFRKVMVLDPHSEISLRLIDNIEVLEVKPYIEKAVKLSGLNKQKDIIFYPDKGAKKRYHDLVDFPCAYGIKNRDWETGQIVGLDVEGVIPQKPFHALIVDDICSFGGTFYHSATKLKELGADKIYLFVTHCENSITKGELIKEDIVQTVYTTNSLFTEENPKIMILE